ncbi:LytR/AlgR family response regulator transcription factor [Flavihumibacter stibioxidans]|uniref:DNA-binding response regulator n=1 Tax=Flavihumibacter stibioxidans TaxID=1834163 RepID=A0ABR7M6H5_9BACT|nr:LytTR family DNA-binding domain-containing protein [Flavihumibacter stibioxidans]MBC6490562.1 DNA-binding response regulator [Flavihumibacter stibioxidans]
MLKAIIIDDEPLACQIVQEYLASWPQVEVVNICHDGFEGFKAIQQQKPDLLFLDIQMPKINGFEMLELVEHPPAIIFTTAFDEYAIKAFDHHAVDYLLKPFSQDRFNKALAKFTGGLAGQSNAISGLSSPSSSSLSSLLESTALSPQQQNRIVIKDNGNIKIIPIEDIHFLEAADDYVKVITAAGQYLKNRTMASLEKQLPAQAFVRIHRSYIVNVREITQLHAHDKETYTAVLRNGKQLPVSKTGYPRLRTVLGM